MAQSHNSYGEAIIEFCESFAFTKIPGSVSLICKLYTDDFEREKNPQ